MCFASYRILLYPSVQPVAFTTDRKVAGNANFEAPQMQVVVLSKHQDESLFQTIARGNIQQARRAHSTLKHQRAPAVSQASRAVP